MNKWISADEMKPGDHEEINDHLDDVLICYKQVCKHCRNIGETIHLAIGYYSGGNEWMIAEPLFEEILPSDLESRIKVTHWMILPKIPE